MVHLWCFDIKTQFHSLTRYLCFLSLFHNKIYIARDTKKWIRSIRFSPDNNVLALASGDSSVYLYNVEDFTSIGRCRGCSGPVTRIDFSSDSQWLHCNSGKQQNAPNKVVLFVVVRVYVY